MPELADVEGWKRYVARYAQGRRVRRVRVRDDQLLRNTSPQGLGRALRGRRLGTPDRRGKWLVVPAGDGRLVLHFGMTGELAWTTRPDEPGPYDQVILELDGGELRYRSRRKLGGVWWVPARGDVADVTGPLGPDAADLDEAGLRRLLADRRGGIKAALMDQELLAGLGNELSDEILWRARIRPDARVEALSDPQRGALHRALRDVLRGSVKHGHIPTTGRWLNAVRGEAHPACPRCGAPVRTGRVAGRTSYWCPRCQP